MKKLKKAIWIWMALMMMVLTGQAQTVDDLFDRFGDKPEAEEVNLGPLLMKFVKMFAVDDSDDEKAIKSIKAMKVLDVGDCPTEIKQEFAREIRNLKPRGMELLMQVKEEGESVRIWAKMKKNAVRQLLVITDESIVRIKGNFNLDEISKVLETTTQD